MNQLFIVTDQTEASPVKRVFVSFIPHHPYGGKPRRAGLRFFASSRLLTETLIEASHPIRRTSRVHFPLADKRRATACREKRPRQPDHTFACSNSSSCGIAGRENDQIGVELEAHDLSRFQQAIVVSVVFRLCKQ